jgi:hypothetical protein
MKWTIGKFSGLKDSLSVDDIIQEMEKDGYCCHICARVERGRSYAKIADKDAHLHDVCCLKCLEKAQEMGFLHIEQEV